MSQKSHGGHPTRQEVPQEVFEREEGPLGKTFGEVFLWIRSELPPIHPITLQSINYFFNLTFIKSIFHHVFLLELI